MDRDSLFYFLAKHSPLAGRNDPTIDISQGTHVDHLDRENILTNLEDYIFRGN